MHSNSLMMIIFEFPLRLTCLYLKRKKVTIIIPTQFSKIQTSKLLILIHASNLELASLIEMYSNIALFILITLMKMGSLDSKSYYL